MKTRFYLFSILLVLSANTVSGQWKFNNPYPGASYIYDMAFANSNLGIVVGGIKPMRTEDGGISWEEIYFNDEIYQQPGDFLSACFAGEQNVYIAGDSGRILHSSDGGLNWEFQASTTQDILFDIFFVNETTGWAAGYNKTIIKTSDGGNTWTTQFSDDNGSFNSICFVNEDKGWCCGWNGLILSTNDGGETWTQQQSGLSSTIRAIDFVNENTGWAIGDDTKLIKTANGGNSWGQIYDFGTNSYPYDIYFIDENTGFMSDLFGKIYKTTDGGQSWSMIYSYDATVYSITGTGNNLWIGGITEYGGFDKGTFISRSTDAGNSWNELSYSRLKPYTAGYSVYLTDFIDDNNGWIFALNSETLTTVVFETTDGGNSWELMNTNNTLSYFMGADFVNSSEGWGCNGWIYHTSDAGETWEAQYQPPLIPDELFAISMIDNSTGWCVGENGILLKTDNGNTWELHNTGKSNDLQDIFFITPQTGWISGENGLILKTVDGGETWTQQTSNTSQILTSITFWDEQNGWIAGENGTIVHTTDGGETWTTQEAGITENLNKIACAGPQNAWIITSGQSSLYHTNLYFTNDGGYSWEKYYRNFGVGVGLLDICFTSENEGWIVGQNALILHTENCGGLVGFQDRKYISDNSQIMCYPNPLTSGTTVRYVIKYPQVVKIDILYASGKQIKTIANKFQLPGEHSVDWNASGLPAGVYFVVISKQTGKEVIKIVKSGE